MVTVNLESDNIWLGIILVVVAMLNFGFYIEMFRRIHRIDSRKAWIGLIFWPAMLVYGAQYWSDVKIPYAGHLTSMLAAIATLIGVHAFTYA